MGVFSKRIFLQGYFGYTLSHTSVEEAGHFPAHPILVLMLAYFHNLNIAYVLYNYYRVYNGLKPGLVVGEPELIKDILVKDFHNFTDRTNGRRIHPILRQHLVNAEGEQWRRVRGIVSPTFSSGKMKRMYPLIKGCLNEFLEALDVIASEGKDLDVKLAYGNYTMDVIATCAFG